MRLKKHIKRSTSNHKMKEFMVSGLTLLSAVIVRRMIKYLWKVSTNTEPPENPASHKVSLGEAFLFTVVTGVLVSVVKLFVRRNVSLEVEENY